MGTGRRSGDRTSISQKEKQKALAVYLCGAAEVSIEGKVQTAYLDTRGFVARTATGLNPALYLFTGSDTTGRSFRMGAVDGYRCKAKAMGGIQ